MDELALEILANKWRSNWDWKGQESIGLTFYSRYRNELILIFWKNAESCLVTVGCNWTEEGDLWFHRRFRHGQLAALYIQRVVQLPRRIRNRQN